MPHHVLGPGDHIVFQMRIHRRARVVRARLDRRNEPHQRPTVVAFRKPLAMHQVSPVQLGIGVQESVGGHQVHPGMMVPARQERLQHTGGRRLADRHAAGDPDDERHRPVRVLLRFTQELGGGGEQPLARRDLQVNQPGQRQVNLFDFEQVDLFTQTAQADQFLLGEGQRRRHTKRTPLLSVELHIRARLAKPRHSASVAGAPKSPTAGLAKSRRWIDWRRDCCT